MFFSFLKSQVAERNKSQNSVWAAAGRGGLLCPVWQEIKAVPRCDEGTSVLQHCSIVYSCDPEANVLRQNEWAVEFVTGWEYERDQITALWVEGYFY